MNEVQLYKGWYSDRVAFLERLTNYGKARNTSKIIIDIQHFQWDILQAGWALPFESLLVSSLENKESATVFIRKREL